MTELLSSQETLLLWRLLGQQGEALQQALDEAKPAVDAKVRRSLEKRGLVATRTVHRALVLKVTEKGWHWAGQHLLDDLPRGIPSVFRDWLRLVRGYLDRSGETLAGFIGEKPALPDLETKSVNKTRSPRNPGKPKESAHAPEPLTAEELRTRMEQAYLAVTGDKKNEMAMLSKVRAELADLDRETVDEGLLAILQGRHPKAQLTGIGDLKLLTEADRKAAFHRGGEAYHVLWIRT